MPQSVNHRRGLVFCPLARRIMPGTAAVALLIGAVAAGVTVPAPKALASGTVFAGTAQTRNPGPGPALLFPAPPGGEAGVSYRDQLTVTGGTSPFTWSVSSGSLPAGISLGAGGTLGGTPAAAGTSSFTVAVTDANGRSATETTSITVSAGVSTTFPAPPAAVVGTAYTDTLTAAGGTTPYTWSVSAGTLPAGISLRADGTLSGTPAAAGTSGFTVTVTDAQSNTAAFATSITVLGGMLAIATTASTATTTPGGTVSYTITATNTGEITLTGATFTDSLSGVVDDARYGKDATATAGSVRFARPDLTWTGNLAAGASATITFSVTVNNPDAGNTVLASTATRTVNLNPPGTGDKHLVSAVTSTSAGSTCPPASTNPACITRVTDLAPAPAIANTATAGPAITNIVNAGSLSLTSAANAKLSSATPGSATSGGTITGGTITGVLGIVTVTDDRGLGADWTATVSATGFATGTGTPAETIPASDALYNVTALGTATGSATLTPAASTQLSASPQAVVNATNVTGDTTANWIPAIKVTIPAGTIGGTYTAAITYSVSLPAPPALRHPRCATRAGGRSSRR